MRARSARRLSVLPARTQLSSMDRSSGVKVRAVGYLLIPHHGIYRLSLQLSTSRKIKRCQRHRGRETHDGGDAGELLFPSHAAAATCILGWKPHPYPLAKLGLREIRSQAPLTNQQLTSNASEK